MKTNIAKNKYFVNNVRYCTLNNGKIINKNYVNFWINTLFLENKLPACEI